MYKLKSFLLLIVVLVIYLFSNPSLHVAGDLNIAGYLLRGPSVAGYYFISPFLAKPLSYLYQILPITNWWAVFSVCIMFTGLWIILNTLMKRTSSWVITILFLLVFWLTICSEPINFTVTASVAVIVAMVLLIEASESHKQETENRLRMVYIIGGGGGISYLHLVYG